MSGFIQVSTATDSRDSAVALARSAVEAKLAAGAQIVGPVVSVVWHLGKVHEGDEWQVRLTTRADLCPRLQEHLIANHPWKNPEVIVVLIGELSSSYADWIERETAHE